MSRRVRVLTAVMPVIAGITLAMPAAVAVAAPAPAPLNFDASARLGNQGEDAIVAVNPTDPLNVVATSCDAGQVNLDGLFGAVSFNGGLTWTRRLIATGASLGHTCDEDLAWDRYGNLWLTHLAASGAVAVAVSTDGGLRFSKVTDIIPATPKGYTAPKGALSGQPDYLSAVADRPSIAVGPGSVWVSYTSVPSAVIQASGARVTGRGRFGSFSAPESVPTSAGRGGFPGTGGIAVGSRGQVLVVYQNLGGQCCSRIYTALDPDGLGPRGFGRPRLLAATNVEEGLRIPAQPDRGIGADPTLAWDRSGGPHNGRVYAVWTQRPKNTANTNIMFQYSDDNGTTWTKAVQLNDDHAVSSQFFPALAVDQSTGDVAVSWYKSGDTSGMPNAYTQIWATFSVDGGVAFAPEFRVSKGTSNAKDAKSFFDSGDYSGAAFVSHRFYPGWADNSDRTGTNPNGALHDLDLYTALVFIPSSGPGKVQVGALPTVSDGTAGGVEQVATTPPLLHRADR
jgi:BNR/Asp-box repeat